MRKSIKMLVAFIFVAAVMLIFSIGNSYAESKIVYADLSMIFEGYQKTKDFDVELEGTQKSKQKEIDGKVDAIKKLQDKLSLLSDKEKEKKEGEIEKKTRLLQDFQRNTEMDLRKTRDEKLKEILKDIQDVVEEIAKKEKYDFILNDRVLLYGNESADISKSILTDLNKKYKKKR